MWGLSDRDRYPRPENRTASGDTAPTNATWELDDYTSAERIGQINPTLFIQTNGLRGTLPVNYAREPLGCWASPARWQERVAGWQKWVLEGCPIPGQLVQGQAKGITDPCDSCLIQVAVER